MLLPRSVRLGLGMPNSGSPLKITLNTPSIVADKRDILAILPSVTIVSAFSCVENVGSRRSQMCSGAQWAGSLVIFGQQPN